MENRNEDFLKLLTKTKDSIKNIQDITKEKNKIEKSIENIRTEATKINTFLKKFDQVIDEESKNINSYKSETNSIQFELLRKDTDKIRSIIQSNLPNNIISKEYEDKVELYKINSVEKNKKRIVQCEEYTGYIEIEELESNQNKVNVGIKDESRKAHIVESFIVTDPLRIYNIIVYLNMKLNYETT